MSLLIQFLLVLTPCCVYAWTSEMENVGFYEGDMVLTPAQQQRIDNGLHPFGSSRTNHWPTDKAIPYSFGPNLAINFGKQKVLDAIRDYERFTCLRFKRRTTEKWGMHFYMGGGCFGPVGFHGFDTVNRISLGQGCWNKATALHEIMHSLGVFHEQSRPDRDQYVRIKWNNIPEKVKFNFKKKTNDEVDSLLTPYDYRSVMHYSSIAFGGRKMTIETIDPDMQNQIGQRRGLSEIDIIQLNLMYKCYDVPPPQSPTCYDQLSVCASLAKKGKCSEASWDSFMQSNCRYSCKLCDTPFTRPPTARPISTNQPELKTTSVPEKVSTQKPTKQPTNEPTKQPTKQPTNQPTTSGTGGGDCRDVMGNQCDAYKDVCDSWKGFTKRFCRNTCGWCT